MTNLIAAPSLNPAVRIRLTLIGDTPEAKRTFGVRRQKGLYYPFESYNGRGEYTYYGEHGTLDEALQQLLRITGAEGIEVSRVHEGWTVPTS